MGLSGVVRYVIIENDMGLSCVFCYVSSAEVDNIKCIFFLYIHTFQVYIKNSLSFDFYILDAKGRKIIPIVKDEKVVYPRVLRGITTIKTSTLKYGDSFWRRLTSSLSVFPSHSVCATDQESSKTELGHRRENTSFIDKNIIDFGDTSNLSRDSVSLRSGSFDSTSEFGESENVDTRSRTPKSGLLFTKSKFKSENKSSKIYKTLSVPDILDAGNIETQRAVSSSTDNIAVTSSSSCCSLGHTDEKRGNRKKTYKSPKDWLFRKFFNTFQISNKAKSNRMASSDIVCRNDEGCSTAKHKDKHPPSYTEPYKQNYDEKFVMSEKSIHSDETGLIPSSGQIKLKENPVTFSLESQKSFDEASGSRESQFETESGQENKVTDVNVRETTLTSVSQRTVFTMDI